VRSSRAVKIGDARRNIQGTVMLLKVGRQVCLQFCGDMSEVWGSGSCRRQVLSVRWLVSCEHAVSTVEHTENGDGTGSEGFGAEVLGGRSGRRLPSGQRCMQGRNTLWWTRNNHPARYKVRPWRAFLKKTRRDERERVRSNGRCDTTGRVERGGETSGLRVAGATPISLGKKRPEKGLGVYVSINELVLVPAETGARTFHSRRAQTQPGRARSEQRRGDSRAFAGSGPKEDFTTSRRGGKRLR